MRLTASLLLFPALAVVVQLSLLPFFGLASVLSLPVLLIVYAGAFEEKTGRHAPFTALATGLLLDCFSPLPFGLFLVTAFSTWAVTHALMLHVVTNRSLWSMLTLTLAGTATFAAARFVGQLLLSMVAHGVARPSVTVQHLELLAWTTAMSLLLFYLLLAARSFLSRYFFLPTRR